MKLYMLEYTTESISEAYGEWSSDTIVHRPIFSRNKESLYIKINDIEGKLKGSYGYEKLGEWEISEILDSDIIP